MKGAQMLEVSLSGAGKRCSVSKGMRRQWSKDLGKRQMSIPPLLPHTIYWYSSVDLLRAKHHPEEKSEDTCSKAERGTRHHWPHPVPTALRHHGCCRRRPLRVPRRRPMGPAATPADWRRKKKRSKNNGTKKKRMLPLAPRAGA